MASLSSMQIARVAYDACNSAAIQYGYPPSPPYDHDGDRQNQMLQMVNSIIAGKPYTLDMAEPSVLSSVPGHVLSQMVYKITLGITRALANIPAAE